MTTPGSLEGQHTLATAVARYDQLRMRDLLAPPGLEPGAVDGLAATPLSQQEALELLALSEVIVRKAAYGRQLTVRAARAAGASWAQIGAAMGTTKRPGTVTSGGLRISSTRSCPGKTGAAQ